MYQSQFLYLPYSFAFKRKTHRKLIKTDANIMSMSDTKYLILDRGRNYSGHFVHYQIELICHPGGNGN